MINKNNKSASYYSIFNLNILECIEGNDNIILDVGCAYGLVGKALKECKKAKLVIGVEINPDAAAVARENLDKVLCQDIENIQLTYENYFDYIILSHVLEHMYDPLNVLTKLKKTLKELGKLIVVLPNIKYWRILKDLILLDKWDYKEAGILDIDHKWYFTYTSAIELVMKAEYQIVKSWVEVSGPKKKLIKKLTGRIFEKYLSQEIFIICSKK